MIDTTSYPMLVKEESWKVQWDIYNKQQEFQKCCACTLTISPKEEME